MKLFTFLIIGLINMLSRNIIMQVNSSNKIIATLKEYYEEINNMVMGGKRGIDQFLFGTDNRSDAAEFNLDKMIKKPHGVCFRHIDSQSVVRKYTPGTGIFYDIPHASEKTLISEFLRDSIIAGVSDSAGFSANHSKLISDIIKDYTVAFATTRWKYALDTLRTGKFSPLGMNGHDIGGLEIDFSRDSSLDITFDFTATGATIDAALKNLYDAYRAQGGNLDNLCAIIGSGWQYVLEEDDDVLTRMQANSANVMTEFNINPPSFMNVQGLYFIGRYRIPGTLAAVNLLGYSPQDNFVAYSGATAVDFFPSDEALMFSSGDKRYRIFGGVDALSDSGKAIRIAGSEIVYDSFTEKDPVCEVIRAQTRMAFVPANINHVARSTGTFPQIS